MERVAAKAPASFAPHVKDTQKRLNYLFDHLNNEELVKPDTIGQLNTLAQAIEAKDYAGAQQLQIKIQTEKTEECGQWIVSLISFYMKFPTSGRNLTETILTCVFHYRSV